MFLFIFLAYQSRLPVEVRKENTPLELEALIKELEVKKAEEMYLFHKSRFEKMKSAYDPYNKNLMEEELKTKLSELDLEIAKLNKEISLLLCR